MNLVNTLISDSVLDLQRKCFTDREKNLDQSQENFIEVSEGRMRIFEKFFARGNSRALLSRMEKRLFK
jgi:hypothetical protein